MKLIMENWNKFKEREHTLIDEAAEEFDKNFNDARNAKADILNALGKKKGELSRAAQEKLPNVALRLAQGKIKLADAKKELTESQDRPTGVKLYTAGYLVDGVPGPLFSAPKSFPGALDAVINVATNWQNAGFELDTSQTSEEVLSAISMQEVKEAKVSYPYADPAVEEPDINKKYLFRVRNDNEIFEASSLHGWAVARAAAKKHFEDKGIDSLDGNILTFSPSKRKYI